MTVIDMDTSLKVVNVAPPDHKYSELKFFHGPNRIWILKPGESAYVPYYIVKSWFGDIRSAGDFVNTTAQSDIGTIVATIPPRAAEVARLRAHYGLHTGQDASFVDNQHEIPQVELYTPDGEKLPTVLEDPEGKTTIEATSTISQAESQDKRIAELEALVHKLLADRERPVITPDPVTPETVKNVVRAVDDDDDDEDDGSGGFTRILPTDDIDDDLLPTGRS